jgi:hypothetical protein
MVNPTATNKRLFSFYRERIGLGVILTSSEPVVEVGRAHSDVASVKVKVQWRTNVPWQREVRQEKRSKKKEKKKKEIFYQSPDQLYRPLGIDPKP